MSPRWIGILTLGGLAAAGLEILRRSRFVPIPPMRLEDTRPDGGMTTPEHALPLDPSGHRTPKPGDPEYTNPLGTDDDVVPS